MTLIEWFKILYDDYRAWRAGLIRIVPRKACNGRPIRGRTHSPPLPRQQVAQSRPIATVTAVHMRDGKVLETQVIRGRIH